MTSSVSESLVSTTWLAEHLEHEDLVVLDCTVFLEPVEGGFRAVSGRSDFDQGHLPTAQFADLAHDLCDSGSNLRFAVPTPAHFASAMGQLGVGDQTRVVLYDNNKSMWAARVWWMLRWVGFDNAALLDGGQKAWVAEGRPLTTDVGTVKPATLTANPRPELIVDREEVLASISDDAVCLIDALTEAQFSGDQNSYGRPGHIPGATNTPAMNLLDDTGRFRPDEELASMFEGDRGTRTITYCGGGIAASADAFVMTTKLGFTDVGVYTASLQEWAADEANPLEV